MLLQGTDTKVTHSMSCVDNLDPENVSTVMDTVVSKNIFTDSEGNPLTISLGAFVRTISDEMLFTV